MTGIADLFALALDQHRAGRADQAEASCRAILERMPDHHGAAHLLGLIVHQAGIDACLSRDLERSRAVFDRLAPVVRFMAETGAGGDACMDHRCLVLPVHFYTPVPDIADLDRRDVWSRRSPMAGIDLAVDRQLELWRALGARWGGECHWPERPEGTAPHDFHLANGMFSWGCAAATHSLIRELKPRRVIEVGSGMSSRVIRDALLLNARDAGRPAAEHTIIDPYPDARLESIMPASTVIVRKPVEQTDAEWFGHLEAGDILFVDSGHTVRTGGDVNFLILDILPNLAPGVVCHFHDIPLPFEYGRGYAAHPRFRVFWTEAYLLQAFMALNPSFEVLLTMNLLMQDHGDAVREAFPRYQPDTTSGSFWIRRRS